MRTVRNLIAVSAVALLSFCWAGNAVAIVIKGHFPFHNGMFWNYSSDGEKRLSSFAINGVFTQEEIGTTVILIRDGAVFSALRQEWDGIYLYGEYGPDGFMIPDKPQLFLPYVLDFDKPVESTVTFAKYKNTKKTGEVTGMVVFNLKSIDDLTYNNREYRNCSIVEKTVRIDGRETVETMWMAPSVGPIKREVRKNGKVVTYALASWGGNRDEQAKRFALKEYLPLSAGTVNTYGDRYKNRSVAVEILQQQTKADHRTIPYVEPTGSKYYVVYDDRGLVNPVKYNAVAGLACVYFAPDRPVVLMPNELIMGEMYESIAYYRVSQWPSLTPIMDFYPEMKLSSIPLCIEDVTTPAGTYKDCIKVCLSSLSTAFNMQREKVKIGYIWLARGVGIVRQESINLDNTYLAQSPNFMFDIFLYDLEKQERKQLETVVKKSMPQPATAPAVQPTAKTAQPGTLTWKDNSKAMFEKTVSSSPSFMQSMVEKKLLESITKNAGQGGIVTEEVVIESVKEVTPGPFVEKSLKDLEPLRTR